MLSLSLAKVNASPRSSLNSQETKAMAWRMGWITCYPGGMFMNFRGLSRSDMEQRRVIVCFVGMFAANLMLKSIMQAAISFYSSMVFLSRLAGIAARIYKMWARGKSTS